MHMLMHAEVRQNGEWVRSDATFQSALVKDLQTNRVCDERNPILYEVLGLKDFSGFKHTPIKSVGVFDDGFYCAYLRDFVQYNWDASVLHIGLISEFQYKRYKDGIEPANKHRHIFNDTAKIVTPFEMDLILDDATLRKTDCYYVEIEYGEKTIKEYCSFFCNKTIPSLMKLIPQEGSLDDVRVVYTFVAD